MQASGNREARGKWSSLQLRRKSGRRPGSGRWTPADYTFGSHHFFTNAAIRLNIDIKRDDHPRWSDRKTKRWKWSVEKKIHCAMCEGRLKYERKKKKGQKCKMIKWDNIVWCEFDKRNRAWPNGRDRKKRNKFEKLRMKMIGAQSIRNRLGMQKCEPEVQISKSKWRFKSKRNGKAFSVKAKRRRHDFWLPTNKRGGIERRQNKIKRNQRWTLKNDLEQFERQMENGKRNWTSATIKKKKR